MANGGGLFGGGGIAGLGFDFGDIGSPAFANLMNIFGGFRNEKQFQEFEQGKVEPFNLEQQGLSRGVGQSTQQIVKQGLAGANSPFFNPAAIGRTFNQEGKDINRQFDALRGQTQSNLAARGLGGSTIGTSQSALQLRQRQDALGGLAARKFDAQAQGVRDRLGFLGGFGELGIGGANAASGILGNQIFLPPQNVNNVFSPSPQRS